MGSTFKNKLSMANKLWKSAKESAKTESFGNDYPDGRYRARITDAEVNESQSSGRLQAVFEFVFTEGDLEGQTHRAYEGLETENNLKYFARKLVKLGYDPPDDLGEIDAIFDDLRTRAPEVLIRLKTKGEFQNTFLEKLLECGDVDPDAEAGAGDGIPDEPADEPADDVVEGDAVEIDVGSHVGFAFKGADCTGEILSIDADAGTLVVKNDEDNKKYRVKMEDVWVVEDAADPVEDVVEEVEEEVPPVPPRRATAPVMKKAPPKKVPPPKKGGGGKKK